MTGRRPGATYGKKSSKLAKASPATFESLLTKSPSKPKPSLSQVYNPAKADARINKPTIYGHDQVFDVPLSDEDEGEDELAGHNPPVIQRFAHHTFTPPKSPQQPSRKDEVRRRDVSPSIRNISTKRKQPPVSSARLHKRRSVKSDFRNAQNETHEDKISHEVAKEQRDQSMVTHFSDAMEADYHTSYPQVRIDEPRGFPLVDQPLLVDEENVNSLANTASHQTTGSPPLTSTRDDVDLVNRSLDLPSTPPKQRSPERYSLAGSKALATPKQKIVWQDLFSDQRGTPLSGIKRLKISAKSEQQINRVNSRSKRKLIDTLKLDQCQLDTNQSPEISMERLDPKVQSDEAPNPSQNDFDSAARASRRAPIGQSYSRPAKITYAQQRSYLSEPSAGLDELLTQPLGVNISPRPSNAAHIPKVVRPGDQEVGEGEDHDEGAGAMKSARELRIAGDTRRFDDEMSVIIQDISAPGKSALSSRRSALLDLALKLCDIDFRVRFLQGDYESKTLSHCAEETDPICGVAMSCSIILSLKEVSDPRSSRSLCDANILPNLIELLALPQDIRKLAKQRKLNMSRLAQQDVHNFVRTVGSTGVLSPDQTLSPRSAALHAIELLLRRQREVGDTDKLLGSSAVSKIIEILTQSSTKLIGKTSSIPADTDMMNLKMAFSTLESLTIVHSRAELHESWPEDQINRLVTVGRTIAMSGLADVHLNCLMFRLFLNLSNNNEANSSLFDDSGLLGYILARVESKFSSLQRTTGDDAHKAGFDELILAMGTLFNLAEMSTGPCRTLAMSSSNALDNLVRVFNDQIDKSTQAESDAEGQANVAFGYLAVLLGVLCRVPDGYERVKSGLQNHDMNILINAIQEFTAYNKRVDGEGSNEVWTVFTDRLQAVANALKS